MAAAGGLVLAGAAAGHERSGQPSETTAIPRAVVSAWQPVPALAPATLRTRAARDTTIFLPKAEFLFAPASPEDRAPR
jgi:hypothetical protein